MASGFAVIPCDTCKVSMCVAEAVTRREALFAWVADMSLGCEDYEPDYFHGVEGVLNVSVGSVSGGFGNRRGFRRDGDRPVYGREGGR